MKIEVQHITDSFKSLEKSSLKEEKLNLWAQMKNKINDISMKIEEFNTELEEEKKEEEIEWPIIFKKRINKQSWGWPNNDYEKKLWNEENLGVNFLFMKKSEKIEGETLLEQMKNLLKRINKY